MILFENDWLYTTIYGYINDHHTDLKYGISYVLLHK